MERHAGEHVVLDVILHLPVEEPRQVAQADAARTQPVVRHVRHEAGVLGAGA